MQSIQTALTRLVSLKTTADRPEEIRGAALYIASLFDKTRFRTQIFENNDICSILVSLREHEPLRPKFLLSGHLDVVPAQEDAQYTMKIRGNRAYGRGTFDMKGTVAIFINVMQKLGELKNPPSCALLVTGDEETEGDKGTGYLVRECGLAPEFVLCGDGGESYWELVIKEKGLLWLELTAKGSGGHAAYLWEGENAVEKIIRAVAKIQDFIGKVKPKAWKTTANLAFIETSNRTPNVVPSDARAVLDIRFTEDLAATPGELTQKLRGLVPEVEARAIGKAPLIMVSEQNPLVEHFKRTVDRVLGKSVPLTFEHGTSDMRYFSEKGIPWVIFGPLGANAHAKDEWVDMDSLQKLEDILLRFLQK